MCLHSSSAAYGLIGASQNEHNANGPTKRSILEVLGFRDKQFYVESTAKTLEATY